MSSGSRSVEHGCVDVLGFEVHASWSFPSHAEAPWYHNDNMSFFTGLCTPDTRIEASTLRPLIPTKLSQLNPTPKPHPRSHPELCSPILRPESGYHVDAKPLHAMNRFGVLSGLGFGALDSWASGSGSAGGVFSV